MAAGSSCEDCHTTKKCVTIRQSDLLLCNDCQKIRNDAETAKNTASGRWKVTPIRTKQPPNASASRKSSEHFAPIVDKTRTEKPTTPKVTKAKSNKQTITPSNNENAIQITEPDAASKLCSNQVCSIKADDVTCSCFICSKEFHLTCVQLTRRPPKTSNWCCPSCRDVPSLIKELNNTVNVLSAWQRSMYEHQQELKAENKALKEQLREVMSMIPKQRQPTSDNNSVQDQAHPPSESDISSTDYEPEEGTTPWVTVRRRNIRTAAPRRPVDRERVTKFSNVKRTIRYNLHESRDREIPA